MFWKALKRVKQPKTQQNRTFLLDTILKGCNQHIFLSDALSDDWGTT